MSRSHRTRLARPDIPAAARYLIRHRGRTPAIVICLLSCLAQLPARADPPALPPLAERHPESTAGTLEILAREGAPGEERKVWIYFTDKGVSGQDAFRIRLLELAAALDPHAASRRARSLGPWLTDFHDLPVCESYVDEVRLRGGEIVRRSRWLNAVSVRSSLVNLRRIAALPFVRQITPVAAGHGPKAEPAITPPPVSDGIGRPSMFDYGPSYGQMEEIGVVAAHDLGLSGAGVRIALMDTGYWREHPTFQRVLAEDRLLAQWDFIQNDSETQDEPGDPEGQHNHGTSVWSLVAGFTEGELIGTAYGADFILAKTEDTADEYPAEEDNWIAAMEWADSLGADIISTSLNYIEWYTYEDMDGDTAPITIGSDIAAQRGMVVCMGAGNWGTQDWYYIGAPADGDSVIAVGASEPDGTLWSDSSHGPTYDGRTKPEVVARGASTYGAVVPGGHGGPDLFRNMDGTSVSCPLVAGSAALLLEAHPNWSAMEVREALTMTADNADSPDNDRGWGRIDVMAALGYATDAPEGVVAGSALRLTVTPNPSGGTVRLVCRLPQVAPGRYTRPGLLSADSRLQGRLAIVGPGGALVWEQLVEGPVTVLTWDGRDAEGRALVSGVYYARLLFTGRKASAKIILVR